MYFLGCSLRAWICGLVSVIDFGEFLAISCSNVSCSVLSYASGIPHIVCYLQVPATIVHFKAIQKLLIEHQLCKVLGVEEMSNSPFFKKVRLLWG